MSTIYQLGISSANAITIYPEFKMKPDKKQIRNEHRSKSGRLRLYKWGDYERFSLPLSFVPTSEAAIINSWWDTNTELLLFINSDSTIAVHSVMILNKESPINEYQAPYQTYMKGIVKLEGY